MLVLPELANRVRGVGAPDADQLTKTLLLCRVRPPCRQGEQLDDAQLCDAIFGCAYGSRRRTVDALLFFGRLVEYGVVNFIP